MLRLSIGTYTVLVTSSPDEVRLFESDGAHIQRLACDQDHRSFIAIGLSNGDPRPGLLVEGWYSPGPSSGFHPGVLIDPTNELVFLGLGEEAFSFSLDPVGLIAREEVQCGFWGWSRHGDTVVMSAELEIAGWSPAGNKIWSRFVEPPWSYQVLGEIIELDVMGTKKSLYLATGEELAD